MRGPGAYVPPGARGSGAPIPVRTESNRSANANAIANANANLAPDPAHVEVPQLSVNGPDGKPSAVPAVPKVPLRPLYLQICVAYHNLFFGAGG